MLKVTRLSAKFDIPALLQGKIVINSVQLFGFHIHLNRDTQTGEPNYQFVLDTFASQDTVPKEKQLDLRINSILIRRGNLAYDVLTTTNTPGKFNPHHIHIQNIIANISLKALKRDSLNAAVKRLSFEEQSGFKLQKLSFKVLADKQRLKIVNFAFALPGTAVQMDTLHMEYDSLEAFNHFADQVRFSGKIKNSRFTLADISPFISTLNAFKDPLYMQMEFGGTLNQIECRALKIHASGDLQLQGNLSLQDISQADEAYLFGNLSNLQLSRTGMEYLVRNLSKNYSGTPPILKRIGNLSFHGEVSGYFNDLVTYGVFHTDLGSFKTDLKLSNDKENSKMVYSGTIQTDGFEIGKLLDKTETFGKSAFYIRLNGIQRPNEWPDIETKGIISSLEYSKYQYENIVLDGKYQKGGVIGKISLEDTNGQILLNGQFNISQKIPTFNFQAAINNFSPNKLHLTNKYKNGIFSMKLNADFTGNSIDNLIGEIDITDFNFQSPGKQYFFDRFQITASAQQEKKTLVFNSNFFTGTIEGDYSYQTIPLSAIKIVERYIPSLLTSKEEKKESHNNFNFDLHIYDTNILSTLLDVPLDIKTHSTLKGYFNDNLDKIRLEGYFPHFTYGNNRFESGMILCESLSDQLRFRIRATHPMKENTISFSLETFAKNNQLQTFIHWGNNSKVTYSGSFEAITDFFKTADEHPLLQAHIQVNPSQVILNDTVWKIYPSHIKIGSGHVFVDNFLFKHKQQYVNIQGKLSQQEKDSLKVRLNDINLDYIFDIIHFKAVEFRGKASGTISVSQALKDPNLNAKLSVRNFTFNKSPMGNMQAFAKWDKEKEGIWLDANMQDPGASATSVKGYILPTKKGLDLHIRADSTNLKFLEFFTKDIASDVKGHATGNVRLFGGFKSLNLEGSVLADAEFKINVLNTTFGIRKDSVVLVPDHIRFRNLTLYDSESHTGKLNGDLWHQNLKNLSYRFHMDTNNMLVFNTKESPDYQFYGTVYGTGNVLLNGNPSGLNVDVSMRTNKNTNFVYITGITTSATNNQFINFVDKTPKRPIHNTIFTDMETPLIKKEEDIPIDIRLNFQIDATPDATMKIVIDPVAGDYISGRGNGNIRMDYFNKGDMKMFGTYTLDQGMYKFSLQEIIRKDFIIKSGSTLNFNGDLFNANMDILASYTVNSASLSDLGLGENFSQNNVKVNCIMNLTGNLLKPTIKFDLELPNVNEEEKELVKTAINTEEQMNMQILYLLGIGKFYTYDYANNGNGQSSNTMNSVLSSTLSGQLNNMLSQVINSNNWNFGTTLSTGEKGWTDMEVEGMLSGQLLNNRLLINGNFGYRDNPMANTNFVGDFYVEWLLTRSGELRLKGYNQTNDRYYTKTTLTTQGIGIVYKKDFNNWHDLLLWHRKKPLKNLSVQPSDSLTTDTLPSPRSQKKRER